MARIRLILPVLVLALTGCASMSGPECAMSDWRAVGFEDGARGRSPTKIGDYRKACAKHGVAPDFEAYRSGHAQGLETYCREGNGFNVGSRGLQYEGVCPAEYEERFLAGYRKGWYLHELNVALASVSSRIDSKRGALHETKKRLREKQAAVLDKETPDDTRAQLVVEIYELGKRQGALEADIEALEREFGARQEELTRYQESLAYMP